MAAKEASDAIAQAKIDTEKALADKGIADKKAADAVAAHTAAKIALDKAVAAAAAAETTNAAAAQKLRDTLFANDSAFDAAINKQVVEA